MQLESSSLNGSQRLYSRTPASPSERHDIQLSFTQWQPHIQPVLARESAELPSALYAMKIQISVHVELKKLQYNDEGESQIRYIDPHFNSESVRYDSITLNKDVSSMLQQLISGFEAFIECGSGWTLHRVIKMFLKTFRFRELRGGTGL